MDRDTVGIEVCRRDHQENRLFLKPGEHIFGQQNGSDRSRLSLQRRRIKGLGAKNVRYETKLLFKQGEGSKVSRAPLDRPQVNTCRMKYLVFGTVCRRCKVRIVGEFPGRKIRNNAEADR